MLVYTGLIIRSLSKSQCLSCRPNNTTINRLVCLPQYIGRHIQIIHVSAYIIAHLINLNSSTLAHTQIAHSLSACPTYFDILPGSRYVLSLIHEIRYSHSFVMYSIPVLMLLLCLLNSSTDWFLLRASLSFKSVGT